MAYEHTKRPLGIVIENPLLSQWKRTEPEGASQTYSEGSPVTWSSGLIIAATDPISTDDNSLVGIALRAGQNLASGAFAEFMPVFDGVVVYGNAMTGDGADYVLTAADMGAAAGNAVSSKSGFYKSGRTDWFLDVADTNGATIVSFKSDFAEPNQADPRSNVGDTNARVGFLFIDGVRLWD